MREGKQTNSLSTLFCKFVGFFVVVIRNEKEFKETRNSQLNYKVAFHFATSEVLSLRSIRSEHKIFTCGDKTVSRLWAAPGPVFWEAPCFYRSDVDLSSRPFLEEASDRGAPITGPRGYIPRNSSSTTEEPLHWPRSYSPGLFTPSTTALSTD